MSFVPHPMTDRCRAWLEAQVGPCTVGAPIEGATTATVVPVRSASREYVLKWFTWDRFLDEEPDRVTRETHGLALADQAGVPAPGMVAADFDGAATGFPALLMTQIAGASLPRPRDWSVEAARAAIGLHSLDGLTPHHHSPYNPEPFMPSWAEDAALWSDALSVVSDLGLSGEAIIHRDLHRWNMHWHEGRLSGVVDWLSACRGPIGEDVGRVWINEVLEGDPQGGAAFRAAYAAEGPAWDFRWEVQSVLDTLPAYESEEAVHGWGDPVSRVRLEASLALSLRQL